MKIIDIVTRDMHQLHGANKVTEKLIRGLEQFHKAGYELRYVISQDGIIKCNEYIDSTLGIHLNKQSYLRKRRIIEFLKKNPIYKSSYIQKRIIESDIKNNGKVIDLLKTIDRQADIVIFQDPFTGVFCLENGFKVNKSIFISHAADDPLEQLLIGRPSLKGTKEEQKLRNRLLDLFQRVDRVVTICNSSYQYMQDTYGIETTCILNGIEDIPDFSEKNHKKKDVYNFVTVASLQYRKGQDILIDAVKRLDKKYKEKVRIHLAGTGDAEETLKNSVKKNSLEDYVIFHGPVLNVHELLQEMDVFILSSRADTVPISIIEAMRDGLPVFASNLGEIPYMISGCGRVMEPTVEEVSTIIMDVVDGAYDLPALSKASRDRYLDIFTNEKMVEQYIGVLNSINLKSHRKINQNSY